MKRKFTVTILFLSVLMLTSFDVMAKKYAVYFTDKVNTPYSIDNPQAFVSERSIARRARYNIPFTEEDLPVDPAYVQQLVDLGATVIHTSRWMNLAMISCNDNVASQIENLSCVSQVIYISPETYNGMPTKYADKFEKASKVRSEGQKDNDDEYYGEGFDQIDQINGIPVHEQGYTGEGILIAVLDGGFDNADDIPGLAHVYDEGRMVMTANVVHPGYDIYSANTSSHGTNTFSCIAANTPGSFVGTAPDASFALILTEDGASEYLVECYNWLIGAEIADSIGADLISSSLGYHNFDDESMSYTHEEVDGNTVVSSIAARIATEKGIFVSVSAGNDNLTLFPWVSSPADNVNVCTVGAVMKSGSIAYFSSLGPNGAGDPKPDVCALGAEATVLEPDGSVGYNSGTSFSCPITSGMIACIIQANMSIKPVDLLQIINQTGDRYPDHDDAYGYGIPDYEEVLQNALALSELEFSQYTLHEIEGNGDGMLQAGETASFDVTIHNKSDHEITNISLSFNVTDENISINAENQNIASINAGDSVTINNAFFLTLSDNVTPAKSVEVIGNFVYDNGQTVQKINIMVYGGNLDFDEVVIINDNDNDGILEPGETADMIVYVINNGNQVVNNVQGQLTTEYDFLNINSGESFYGNIEGGQSKYASFNVTLSDDAQGMKTEIPLTLNLSGENYANTVNFTYSDKCDLIFNLMDSFGDGWNGAYITLSFSDGTPNQDITFEEPLSQKQVVVSVNHGTMVTVTWHEGEYDYETSFTITYADGSLLYEIEDADEGFLTDITVNCLMSTPTLCLPPTNVNAQITDNAVTLTWEAAPGSQPTSYNVYRNQQFVENVEGTTYTDNNPLNGENCYMLEAVYMDGCISEASDDACVTVGGEILPGDVNTDGNVNLADVQTVVNYILMNNPSPFNFQNADVNGDAMINILDVTNIVSIIINNR